MDYLKTVSEPAHYRPKEGTRERMELRERAADAKSRICLYGSTKVIQAFSKWEELGTTMETEEQRFVFIEMVRVMRVDSDGEIEVSVKDLGNVLFGVHK